MKIRTTLIAIALTFGLGTAAQAAGGTSTLVAGPLLPRGETLLLCAVMNVSTKEVNVTVEALDQVGAIAGVRASLVLPGNGLDVLASDADLFGLGWCRFTVSGKASAIRATASIFEEGRGTISAVAAH